MSHAPDRRANLGAVPEVSDDAILGGGLRLLQPRRGHRAGHDAVLLAAACPAEPGERVADLGAGVGTVGLSVAVRVPGTCVILVESDPALAALASENARRNGLTDRAAVIEADLAGSAAQRRAAGLAPEIADHVLFNPPFHAPGRSRVPPEKARAHVAGEGTLESWTRTAVSIVRSGGTVTLIHRPEALPQLLRAVERRLGALTLLPVHAGPARPALRILLQGMRGSRAALRLLPPLVLADEAGRNTAAAETVLRGGALPLDAEALHRLTATNRT